MLTIARTIATNLRADELEALATLAEARPSDQIPELKAVQSLLRLRLLETKPRTRSVQLTDLGRLVVAETKEFCPAAP